MPELVYPSERALCNAMPMRGARHTVQACYKQPLRQSIHRVRGPHCRPFTLHAAAAQGLSYRETEGDEVEDMLQLIAHVQRRHPQLQAVSSGAIASDYQRLRVEHVSFPRRQAPHCSCHPAPACSPSLVVFASQPTAQRPTAVH